MKFYFFILTTGFAMAQDISFKDKVYKINTKKDKVEVLFETHAARYSVGLKSKELKKLEKSLTENKEIEVFINENDVIKGVK